MNPPICKRRPAYTLVELMVALGAGSLLMAGMASTVFLGGRSLDHGGAKAVQTKQANDAFDDVALDLGHATSFTERAAHAVTFKVPDRNGDEVPETIRYSWSGTPGDPLLMAYNGGTPATLAASVRAFNLTYLTRPVTGTGFCKGLIIDPNCVAWWQLDEGTGTTAYDTTDNANNGTLDSGPTWTAGYSGNALRLDGSNDHVDVPHKAVLSITSQLTITAWIWFNSSGTSDWRCILIKGTADKTFNYYIMTNDRQFVFGFYNGDYREFQSPNTLATERWYHVAATVEINGSGRRIRLYEDGVQVSDQTTTRVPLANSGAMNIGKSRYGEYWKGILDDIRIYNRKLSADEIMGIKNGTFF